GRSRPAARRRRRPRSPASSGGRQRTLRPGSPEGMESRCSSGTLHHTVWYGYCHGAGRARNRVLLKAMAYGSERNGRLSADDWAHAALELIAEQGVASVAVEPLARRLGVTKGSFYWHFPSREALLVAALEHWEQVEQQEVFGQLEAIPNPGQRLRALFDLVAHEARSHIIYSELLKALDHPVVRPDRKSTRLNSSHVKSS